MANQLYEADALMAVAKAQGFLYKCAQQMLKRDKADGMRMCEIMRKHDAVYCEIRDELRGGPVSNEDVESADKLAGYSDE